MARIRTIKPEFWEDEKVGHLPIPCRLFFIGCWNFADDYGVIKGNPALLKSQIFPYDENLRVSEVKKWLNALVEARMLIPIILDDANKRPAEESYYVIRTFRSHQVLDKRYTKSYLGKDEKFVNSLIDKALQKHNVNTSCPPREHVVNTSEEKEMEMEKEMEEKKKTPIGVKEKTPTPYETFISWIERNTPRVLKLQNGITEPQFKKIMEKYTAEEACAVLRSMENHKDLLKKYTSAYLTFMKWAKKDYGDKS